MFSSKVLRFFVFLLVFLFPVVFYIDAVFAQDRYDSFFARIDYGEIVAGSRYRVKNGSFINNTSLEDADNISFKEAKASIHEMENIDGKNVSFAIGSKIDGGFGVGNDLFLEFEVSYISKYDDSIVSSAFNVSNMAIEYEGLSGFFNLGYSFFGEKSFFPILGFGIGIVSLESEGIYRAPAILHDGESDEDFFAETSVEFDSQNLFLALQFFMGFGVKLTNNVHVDVLYKNLFSFRDLENLYKKNEILDLSKVKDFSVKSHYSDYDNGAIISINVDDEIKLLSDVVSGMQFSNHIFSLGIGFSV